MDKLRAKPEPEPFLGTAEIIRRVQIAQRHPRGRWPSRAWALGLGASAALAVALGGVALRRAGSGRPARLPAEQAAAANGPRAPGPVAAAHAKAVAPGHRPDGAGSHHTAAPPVRAHEVHVTIKDHVGTVWVDGGEVSHGAREWRGPLSVGHHQLAVRVRGQMIRHSFEVAHGDVALTVDPAHARVVVRGPHGGHRADRAP